MLKLRFCPFSAVLAAFLMLSQTSLHSQAQERQKAENDLEYATLDAKAARFAEYGEWASSSAMLSLMLDMRPEKASVYSRAIVADGMLGNSERQQQLLHEALSHGVAIDSLLSGVRSQSISLGRAELYESFLIHIPGTFPWLKRSIDAYLLDYYKFRRDPQGIITYAQIMLQGLPDSQEFLADLASGYVQAGEFDKAMDTYQQILQLNPDNLTALLALGNYLAETGHPGKARPYLARAYELAPTPFLKRTLAKLPLQKISL